LTDAEREQDRKSTMNEFLNRFSSNTNANQSHLTTTESESTTGMAAEEDENADKLRQLIDLMPQMDVKTLKNYLEAYGGDVEKIIDDLFH